MAAARAFAVDVDSPGLADPLLAMMHMVVDGGGFIAPGLRIVERGGSIGVERPRDALPVERLVAVPPSLLVPTDRLVWAEDRDRLRLAEPALHLTAERRAMLDLLLAAYNAADKARWAQRHPMAVLREDAGLRAIVRTIKPGAAVQTGTLAQMFIGNRQVTKGRLAGPLRNVPLIMPVMDFINHHGDGDTFHFHDGRLTVGEVHVDDSDQCFASYGGRRDAIDWALSHAYVDPATPWVASAPVAIDLPGLGRLTIEGLTMDSNHRANPPRTRFAPDGVVLSHALFDTRVSAAATLDVLALPLRALALRQGVAAGRVDAALELLPGALLEADRKALDAAEAALCSHPGSPDTVALLLSATAIQRERLESVLAGPLGHR